jgi:quercetin dioxygenase-like cupin family protein
MADRPQTFPHVVWETGYSIMVFAKAGDELALHTHAVEHSSFVAHGSFRVFDGAGKERILEQGEAIHFPVGRPHGLTALVDGAVLVQAYQPGVTTG